jgi:hypothetical protein
VERADRPSGTGVNWIASGPADRPRRPTNSGNFHLAQPCHICLAPIRMTDAAYRVAPRCRYEPTSDADDLHTHLHTRRRSARIARILFAPRSNTRPTSFQPRSQPGDDPDRKDPGETAHQPAVLSSSRRGPEVTTLDLRDMLRHAPPTLVIAPDGRALIGLCATVTSSPPFDRYERRVADVDGGRAVRLIRFVEVLCGCVGREFRPTRFSSTARAQGLRCG